MGKIEDIEALIATKDQKAFDSLPALLAVVRAAQLLESEISNLYHADLQSINVPIEFYNKYLHLCRVRDVFDNALAALEQSE